LDADREIVAALPSLESGDTRMPGSPMQRHVLNQFTTATDQQMAGNTQAVQLLEIRMSARVQSIGEQGIDPWAAESPGRKADTVDDHEIHYGVGRALIAVRRDHMTRMAYQAVSQIDPQLRLRKFNAEDLAG